MGKGSVALGLVVVALAAGLLVERHRTAEAERERARAELQLGLDASRVLTARLADTGDLRAGQLTGTAVSKGACTSGYLFSDEQTTAAPFSVNYMVDLTRVGRASLRWDAAARTMYVELPGVAVEPPAVDMSRARSTQSGLYISRSCGLAMERQIATRLTATAAARANRPDYLAQVRASARTKVANLIRASLEAAGTGNVVVRVRLATDPRPVGDTRWDVSRSIDEVLADPALRR